MMKQHTALSAVTAIATILFAGQAFAFGGGMGGSLNHGGSAGGHHGGSALSHGSKGSVKGQAGQHQGSGQGMTKGSAGGNGPTTSAESMGKNGMPATMPPTSMGNPQMNVANAMQGQTNGPGSQHNRMNTTGTNTAPVKPATPSTN